MKKLKYYDKVKNWDFSQINYIEESLTNWDLYDQLKKVTNKESKVLDLGTGGGEKVLAFFPECGEILGTDYSNEMVNTAILNLKNSGRKNILFRQMDNLKMNVEENYYDVVVARHTVIDAKQIYKTLKDGGCLLVRGVDKLDCFSLKKMYGGGQGYNDLKPISLIDYENIIEAGFKKIELIPIHIREYYKTTDDLIALLLKAPILDDFSECLENEEIDNKELNYEIINKYILENTNEKGILLIRRYYGIIAYK